MFNLSRSWFRLLVLLAGLAGAGGAHAGAQIYEPLSASVRAALSKAVSDEAPPEIAFSSVSAARAWLAAMSPRLRSRMPDRLMRDEFLLTVHYEAMRAGLDPQLVLGLIQVESNFRKYAISDAGARGYMQVMPFWVKLIGRAQDDLFHLRTNLRYGCVILRHYLDVEHGNLFRALGRYNGTVGQPAYPELVLRAWRGNWSYSAKAATATTLASRGN